MTARVTMTRDEYVAALERQVGRLTIERQAFGDALDRVTAELEALKTATVEPAEAGLRRP